MKRRAPQGKVVVPSRTTITGGTINAPAIFTDQSDADKAIDEVKHRSGLSKFKNWEFNCY
jgi:hypothetical protein